VFRYATIILAVFLLSSCSQFIPQLQERITPKDQRDFTRAIDSFRTTHRVELLKKFQVDFPDSEWGPRADTIILYSSELDQRKTQIEKNSELIDQQQIELNVQKKKNQQLTNDLDELKSLNQQLTEQITQLKGLLIQLEQRPQ
jgi:small-conductance mechanosensitive channel